MILKYIFNPFSLTFKKLWPRSEAEWEIYFNVKNRCNQLYLIEAHQSAFNIKEKIATQKLVSFLAHVNSRSHSG